MYINDHHMYPDKEARIEQIINYPDLPLTR